MKLPKSLNNPVSWTGGVMAGISLLLIFFLFVISLLYQQSNNYVGLFTYIILPVFLVIGLILLPVGMIIRQRKMKHMEAGFVARSWVVDFRDKRVVNATAIFVAGSVLFLLLTGIGSYEAFHYTESVEFCGKMCHKVMEPEYVAYQNSPHANVSCAECHVGPGADWYVKSKLSGIRQVLAVLKNDYPTPIPTPVMHLRPARVTCEQCHWPEQFYSNLLVSEKHFLSDDVNTEWNIELRMKVGASHSAVGNTEGIHWHMNPKIQIEYFDAELDRETIPWVRYINMETGDTTIYMDSENPMDPAETENPEIRTMDCMDCHNRPSHHYKTPMDFVDFELAAGNISVDLPEIKMLSMDILAKKFESNEEADSTIEARVMEYYGDYYPEVLDESKDKVEQAITSLKVAFHKNVFPGMNASWDAYPSQIGHIVFNGCFRCHNDRHTSESGRKISRDCNLCHNIIQQGPKDMLESVPFNGSLEFQHPIDIGEDWKEMLCSDCHRSMY